MEPANKTHTFSNLKNNNQLWTSIAGECISLKKELQKQVLMEQYNVQ